jgi:uncharacterized protein YkwD
MKTNLLQTLFIATNLFLLFSCTPEDKVADQAIETQIVTSYSYSLDETNLVDLINNYRTTHGLNALQIVNHVSYKSQEHNTYMITNNVVNHDLFEQRSNNIIQVLGATHVGENIAYNFSTSEGVLFAWLQSPGHKINLDGDYTHIGISITINPENGKKYYTNMFMKK